MKKCPQCGRNYNDDSMSFCLDDGSKLLFGPASSEARLSESDEQKTAILSEPPAVAGGLTQPTAQLNEQATAIFSKQNDISDTKQSLSAHRAAKPLAALLAGILILVGGFFGYRYFKSGGNEPINSIAVLPFENRSGDADSEYLSDGLAESLIFRLSQLPNLKVSPTSSVFRYKGKETDPQIIAKELGVDSVLTGRVTQRGDSLSISVNLVDTQNGKSLWGEQYERKMSELLTTQREIATTITQKLQLQLAGGDTKGITKKYTDSNDAYQLYLKGRYHFARRTKDDINKAIESYEQALKLDPNFALAYARIAEAYNQLSNYPYASPKVAFPKAKIAAEKAIAIDPTLSEAHAALGNTLTSFNWNWTEAEKSFKRAIELDPNSAAAHYRYGTEYLISVGRTSEALAEVERALEIEPLDPNMVANLGRVYLYDGQTERALAQARRAYEADPNFVIALLIYGLTLNASGAYNDALSLSEKELLASPDNQHMLLVAGYAFGRLGRRADAEKIIERFREISKTQYVIPSFVAAIYSAMGEKDKAFAELEKSIEEHDSWFKWGKVEPLFAPLRNDPRFNDLLKRMNLPE